MFQSKLSKVFMALLLAMVLTVPAFASVGIKIAGEKIGTAADINFPVGTSYAFDGSLFTIPTLATSVATITSGTIDVAVIGGVTPAAGTFTLLGATGVLTAAATTDASSLTAGSIVTAGGIACAKQLYVGDDIDMSVSGTGVYDLTLKTNVADALSIRDSAADIMVFETTTGAPTVTITPNTTVTGTLTQTGAATFTAAIVANGAVTLGDAVTDVNTITGKIAGATPLVFDGTTANNVYTILAVDDPASSSKTVTLPAVTGTVMLGSPAVVITAGATPTLTVYKGNTLYTDTITTDNQDQTITASAGGTAGDRITIIFVSDTGGSGEEVITFHGTLMRSTGTLTIANGTATRQVIEFVSDGTKWNEVSRTAVQAS